MGELIDRINRNRTIKQNEFYGNEYIYLATELLRLELSLALGVIRASCLPFGFIYCGFKYASNKKISVSATREEIVNETDLYGRALG